MQVETAIPYYLVVDGNNKERCGDLMTIAPFS